MSKLRTRARNSGRLFAPLVFRLALRLEQIDWSEVSGSASEQVFVVRAAQKLFKLDALCANFDTWLELEATGVAVARDELGFVTGAPALPTALPGAKDFTQADSIACSIETVRRLSDESSASILPLAALTFGSTLMRRLYGGERTATVLAALREGSDGATVAETLEYVREVMLEIATSYLEAGAAGLLLLHEDNEPDLVEMPAFEALFNLAAYYDVPAVLMCRNAVSAAGAAMLVRMAPDFHLASEIQSKSLTALPAAAASPVEPAGWFALSRWEMDASADPETVHHLRRAALGA